MAWFNWGKKIPPKKQQISKDPTFQANVFARLEYLLHDENKTENEAKMKVVEELTREIIKEKQRLQKQYEEDSKKFANERKRKFDELEKAESQRQIVFKENMHQAERIQNQLLIASVFHQKQVEIMKLQQGLAVLIDPEEKQVIMDKLNELNEYTRKLKHILQSGKVDKEMVDKIKKRLGNWKTNGE